MEGSTAYFAMPYVPSQSRKAMITIARRETLGPGGNNERAEAVSHTPGTFRIKWVEQEKRCADCNNPTHLQWETDAILFHLCQGCAKRMGGIYQKAIRDFTQG